MEIPKRLLVLLACSTTILPYNKKVTSFANNAINRIYKSGNQLVRQGQSTNPDFTCNSKNTKYTVAELVGHNLSDADFFYTDQGVSWLRKKNYYSRNYTPQPVEYDFISNPEAQRHARRGNIYIKYKGTRGCSFGSKCANNFAKENIFNVYYEFWTNDSGGGSNSSWDKYIYLWPIQGQGQAYDLKVHVAATEGSLSLGYGSFTCEGNNCH
ncbi:hypothetical protein JW872_03420 [Candidatus Babeliales bacterium]|nr:hypothetical protein [Candidatus Babeliales bacterium]